MRKLEAIVVSVFMAFSGTNCVAGGEAPANSRDGKQKCAEGKSIPTEEEIIEIAKREINLREGRDHSYSDVDARKSPADCTWTIYAASNPPAPGSGRHLQYSNSGKLIFYRGGK